MVQNHNTGTGEGMGEVLPSSGPLIHQPPSGPLAEPPPLDLSTLPQWQRRYLGALGAGLPEPQARQHCGAYDTSVSHWSVEQAIIESEASDGVFARARAMVVAGRYVVGLPALRDHAAAYAPVVLDDAFDASRDASERGADRVANRRLVLDAAGVTGQSARGPTVVVAVHQQAMAPSEAPVQRPAWLEPPPVAVDP